MRCGKCSNNADANYRFNPEMPLDVNVTKQPTQPQSQPFKNTPQRFSLEPTKAAGQQFRDSLFAMRR
jgi:hypothetical protein